MVRLARKGLNWGFFVKHWFENQCHWIQNAGDKGRRWKENCGKDFKLESCWNWHVLVFFQLRISVRGSFPTKAIRLRPEWKFSACSFWKLTILSLYNTSSFRTQSEFNLARKNSNHSSLKRLGSLSFAWMNQKQMIQRRTSEAIKHKVVMSCWLQNKQQKKGTRIVNWTLWATLPQNGNRLKFGNCKPPWKWEFFEAQKRNLLLWMRDLMTRIT